MVVPARRGRPPRSKARPKHGLSAQLLGTRTAPAIAKARREIHWSDNESKDGGADHASGSGNGPGSTHRWMGRAPRPRDACGEVNLENTEFKDKWEMEITYREYCNFHNVQVQVLKSDSDQYKTKSVMEGCQHRFRSARRNGTSIWVVKEFVKPTSSEEERKRFRPKFGRQPYTSSQLAYTAPVLALMLHDPGCSGAEIRKALKDYTSELTDSQISRIRLESLEALDSSVEYFIRHVNSYMTDEDWDNICAQHQEHESQEMTEAKDE